MFHFFVHFAFVNEMRSLRKKGVESDPLILSPFLFQTLAYKHNIV